MSDKKKKKKEKIKYIDDGRTIVDMSGVGNRPNYANDKNLLRPQSTLKDKWNTYWSTVKKMLLPMFITLASITIVFFFAYLAVGGFM